MITAKVTGWSTRATFWCSKFARVKSGAEYISSISNASSPKYLLIPICLTKPTLRLQSNMAELLDLWWAFAISCSQNKTANPDIPCNVQTFSELCLPDGRSSFDEICDPKQIAYVLDKPVKLNLLLNKTFLFSYSRSFSSKRPILLLQVISSLKPAACRDEFRIIRCCTSWASLRSQLLQSYGAKISIISLCNWPYTYWKLFIIIRMFCSTGFKDPILVWRTVNGKTTDTLLSLREELCFFA